MKANSIALVIAAVLALVFLILISVEARMRQSCQCYYTGECGYDDNKVGFRYHWCGGSCSAYSNWQIEPRCVYPEKMPRGVRTLFSKGQP